jgi:hypothetical protein
LGYLPSLDDLPPGFEWSLSWEAPHMFDAQTTLGAAQTRYYSHAGWFTAEIGIATTPDEIYSVGTDTLGLQPGSTATLVDTVPVGQHSVAYMLRDDPPSSQFRFAKGNILVTLSGPITVEAAVKLAQILEARIPESLTALTPITFPDKLNPEAAAKFDSFVLGKCTPENKVADPQTVFSAQETLFTNCLQMDWVAPEPYNSHKLEYAIYDVTDQVYMLKYSSAHGFGQLFMPGLPGNYEMHVAMDDVLIAVLPFEVR